MSKEDEFEHKLLAIMEGYIDDPTMLCFVLIENAVSLALNCADTELKGMRLVHQAIETSIEKYEEQFS